MFGWDTVIYLLVAALISYALAPKPPNVGAKPASLEDFDVPTAEQGREVAVVFGTVTVTGPNVIWYGNLNSTPITKEGGKK